MIVQVNQINTELVYVPERGKLEKLIPINDSYKLFKMLNI